MWRQLNEEERQKLMVQYKGGAYLLRFLLGFWLLFISIYYLIGIKGAVESIVGKDYFTGIGTLVVLIILGLFFYGIPIRILKKQGTEEIKALNSGNAFMGEAVFLSAGYDIRAGNTGGNKFKYYAIIRLIDEYGNAGGECKCRSIGDLKNKCREGEIISVLKVVKDSGEEYLCMKKNEL